ncbi:MAG: 1,2-phenylacetyl-CoA epoxidase subunit PaaA [Candidatus Limnocylindrales bacterium]
MTDPLALDPVLPERERAAPRLPDESSAEHDERHERFVARVQAGGTVEATDWMPDEYRRGVLRFVEMHANSELMGVLPEREWILRAPTLRRKLALTAKIQDEVGHAQLLYRVAEDLGKSREAMMEDLLAGRTKFHNVFHYPTRTWADVGIIAWLVDAAAIVAQQALRDSSYGPYARTMRKICWEESVHIMHGRDVIVTLMAGTSVQRAMVQEALDRWWGPLMQMHGPRTPREQDRDLYWRIKAKTSEELRQEFLSIYVPRLLELGLTIPDPELRSDGETGEWRYSEPDWAELRTVVTNHGPMSAERLAFRRAAWDDSAWVRTAILAAPVAAA